MQLKQKAKISLLISIQIGAIGAMRWIKPPLPIPQLFPI